MNTLVRDDYLSSRIYLCLVVILAVSQVVPIWAVAYPPLLDYPSHLARITILSHYFDVPAFRDAYELNIRLLPNLAIDALGIPVALAAGVETAGKLFLSLAIVLFYLGVDRLSRALHGRPSWLVLAQAYFVLNVSFLYGFVNYVFGVALFLVSFAVWVATRRKPDARGAAVTCALMVACYFAHLTAFAFFAVGIAVFLAGEVAARHATLRSLALGVVPIVVGGLVYLLARLPHQSGVIVWDGFYGKLKGLGWLVLAYNWPIDVAIGSVFAVAATFLVLRRTQFTGHRSAIALAGVFVVLFVGLPTGLHSGYYIDRRFLIPAVIVALAGVRFEASTRTVQTALGLALLATLARSACVGYYWIELDSKLAQQVELQRQIPDSARVYSMAFIDISDKQQWMHEMAFDKASLYATVNRHAIVSGLISERDSFSVVHRTFLPIGRALPSANVDPERVGWHQIFDHYTYMWCFRLTRPYRDFMDAHCTRIAEGADVLVYTDCLAGAT